MLSDLNLIVTPNIKKHLEKAGSKRCLIRNRDQRKMLLTKFTNDGYPIPEIQYKMQAEISSALDKLERWIEINSHNNLNSLKCICKKNKEEKE